LTVLSKGYGKIVQVLRPDKSKKNRKKEEREEKNDAKKEVNSEEKTLIGKPLLFPEML